MQYRMQAHTRRAVTRQYLSLPMEWHQRHPTGQLLSNANSDVEAAWGPIAPLPMAVGTVAMMVIAIVQMFVADLVLALVGLLVFPAVIVANLAYQRLASPLMTRAQQLRAEVSEIAHESFDGAHGRQDAGPRGRGDASGSPRGPTSCATSTSAPAGCGRRSTRRWPRCRTSASSWCSPSGSSRVLSRRDRRRRRGHRRLPAHDRLVPDPLDRLAARRVPAQRRRLPPGHRGARGDRRDAVRRRASWRRRDRRRRPAWRSSTSATPTTPTQRAARRRQLRRSSRAAPSPWWAPPPPARAR